MKLLTDKELQLKAKGIDMEHTLSLVYKMPLRKDKIQKIKDSVPVEQHQILASLINIEKMRTVFLAAKIIRETV
jgi:RecA/RadA recombinase